MNKEISNKFDYLILSISDDLKWASDNFMEAKTKEDYEVMNDPEKRKSVLDRAIKSQDKAIQDKGGKLGVTVLVELGKPTVSLIYPGEPIPL